MDKKTPFGLIGACAALGLGVAAFSSWEQSRPLYTWGDVDPKVLADVEAVLAWDGTCDLDDPEARRQIKAGERVFHAQAVACLVPEDLFDGGWERRSEDEKAALLFLLGKHYILSGDARVRDFGICDIYPSKRLTVDFDLEDAHWRIKRQPLGYSRALPDSMVVGLASDELFDCPVWSLERRFQYED